MTNYETFARYYDKVVGERLDVALFLRALLKRYSPKAAHILEFGCGSGSMLKVLSDHYETTGIDNSKEMLRIAKKKSPLSKLHLGDITTYRVGELFDAVLCPFDTINHVQSKAQWRKVFANAKRHLKPGGVFIFDINTPTKMERYCNEPITAEITENQISLVEVKRATKADSYTITARLLEKKAVGTKTNKKGTSAKASGRPPAFTMHTMELHELILHPKVVIDEISGFFRTVTLVDPDRRYPNEDTEELYFICRN